MDLVHRLHDFSNAEIPIAAYGFSVVVKTRLQSGLRLVELLLSQVELGRHVHHLFDFRAREIAWVLVLVSRITRSAAD